MQATGNIEKDGKRPVDRESLRETLPSGWESSLGRWEISLGRWEISLGKWESSLGRWESSLGG
jgi:hypothetical protein